MLPFLSVQETFNKTFWTDPLIILIGFARARVKDPKFDLCARARTHFKFEARGVCSKGPVLNFLDSGKYMLNPWLFNFVVAYKLHQFLHWPRVWRWKQVEPLQGQRTWSLLVLWPRNGIDFLWAEFQQKRFLFGQSWKGPIFVDKTMKLWWVWLLNAIVMFNRLWSKLADWILASIP